MIRRGVARKVAKRVKVAGRGSEFPLAGGLARRVVAGKLFAGGTRPASRAANVEYRNLRLLGAVVRF